nr:hypothetical protein [bacterium]
MTTTLPTPETLRSRAAAALVAADRDATNTLYDGPSKEVVHRSAVARAAYARELLTIAAQLEPAPSTAAPAEVSPPDGHEPVRGDVYEYGGEHYSIGDGGTANTVRMSLIGYPASPFNPTAPSGSWFVAPDFVRRFCRRVSPAREAATHPARGDLYRHASTGDEWVVCALDADAVYLA